MEEPLLQWFGFDDAAMAAALALRHEVFVVEQRVPVELEVDADDAGAAHLGAYVDGALVGTLRVVMENGTAKIGRVAVTISARGHGIGRRMLREALRFAASTGCTTASLASQCTATAFYEQLGFVAYGEPFDDAGIPHIHMKRPLTT